MAAGPASTPTPAPSPTLHAQRGAAAAALAPPLPGRRPPHCPSPAPPSARGQGIRARPRPAAHAHARQACQAEPRHNKAAARPAPPLAAAPCFPSFPFTQAYSHLPAWLRSRNFGLSTPLVPQLKPTRPTKLKNVKKQSLPLQGLCMGGVPSVKLGCPMYDAGRRGAILCRPSLIYFRPYLADWGLGSLNGFIFKL